MRSRLVRALAAIVLVAATWLGVGVARADVMPIHRGLPSSGDTYGDPDAGNGLPRAPLIVFSIQLPGAGLITITYRVDARAKAHRVPRLTRPESHMLAQPRHLP